MLFKITNPLDKSIKELSLLIDPYDAVEIRHERNIPFYNRDKNVETIASLLGVGYTKIESLRRSPEFSGVVDDFLCENAIEITEKIRVKLGVLPPERNFRGPLGKRKAITQKDVIEIGQTVVNLVDGVTEELGLKTSETELTTEYVLGVINNQIVFNHDAFDALPLKPKHEPKPKRETQKERNDRLEIENERLDKLAKELKRQLDELGLNKRAA